MYSAQQKTYYLCMGEEVADVKEEEEGEEGCLGFFYSLKSSS